jgi:predicted ATP-dependent serine protease
MSHHECNRCGRVASSTKGLCDACTPQEVLDAATALEFAEDHARDRFERSIRAQRNAYIRDAVASQKATLTRLKRKHKL